MRPAALKFCDASGVGGGLTFANRCARGSRRWLAVRGPGSVFGCSPCMIGRFGLESGASLPSFLDRTRHRGQNARLFSLVACVGAAVIACAGTTAPETGIMGEADRATFSQTSAHDGLDAPDSHENLWQSQRKSKPRWNPAVLCAEEAPRRVLTPL